jgi:hypothetical protein
MNAHDPIIAADRAEEMEARMSLRMAKDRAELTSAWFLNCEHFDGEAREKLQDLFRDCLRKMGALHG